MPSKKSTKAERKPRRERKFPVITFEEALVLASAIQEHAGGQKVRRLTLFEKLDQSPDSNETRRLITASNQYGLTKGSYNAEYLELTPMGIDATGEDIPVAKQTSARFELAIKRIQPFSTLYEKLKGNKLPAREIMMDNFTEEELPVEERAECVDTFVLNAKFLRLLRTISGSQRLVPIEQVLEEGAPVQQGNDTGEVEVTSKAIIESVVKESEEDYAKICFFVTPIGDQGSEQRRHSDFMLEYIIQPSVKEFGLTVIRADQMSKPGMIGKQIIEHILRSRLVIADLSFHNPNVFYELCLRHTTRLPTVQVKREVDSIPFDLNQYRTIPIETRDPYTLLPKIQTYVAEVTNQVRRALANAESGDNPISLYYPNAKLVIDQRK
ncbi:MAG: hypothetical protein KGK08_04545 [Acidobacteriota bacterium]|nr:hypothetical protein [Acidobacteriota bacterium]